MSVITVFGASFTGRHEVAAAAAARLGYRLVPEESILADAAFAGGSTVEKLRASFEKAPRLSLNPSLARARLLAHVRSALAKGLDGDRLVLAGFSGLLVPARVSHVLRVCLVASPEHRAARAREAGLSDDEARRRMKRDDLAAAEWTRLLFGRGPWDQRQFDLRLPMHEMDAAAAAAAIAVQAGRRAVQATEFSRRAWRDFRIAAAATARLTGAGHDEDVECENGVITVLLNRAVLNHAKYGKKLEGLLAGVEGVTEVRVRAGPRYPAAGTLYREEDFQLPAKVLLVDDEKEFVLALSERLGMRDIGASVALNGEDALAQVATDEPEVVVLDLRMPGVDGIEVLRRLKRDHPAVEVIILTGHGTEEDEALARDLGAFAYLQKPVDIDRLTKTMEAAGEKIRRARGSAETGDDG